MRMFIRIKIHISFDFEILRNGFMVLFRCVQKYVCGSKGLKLPLVHQELGTLGDIYTVLK